MATYTLQAGNCILHYYYIIVICHYAGYIYFTSWQLCIALLLHYSNMPLRRLHILYKLAIVYCKFILIEFYKKNQNHYEI